MLDVLKGYHQCLLDNDIHNHIHHTIRSFYVSQSTIRDFVHYNRRMDEVLAGLEGIKKIVDDMVIFDQNEEQQVKHVIGILRCCEEKVSPFNREKFKFCHPPAHFAGLVLSSEGYSVSNEIIDAITNFPTPSSHTYPHSFIGLTNQLTICTNKLAPVLAPLQPLLSTHNDCLWTSVHDIAFQQVKIANDHACTRLLDPSKETCAQPPSRCTPRSSMFISKKSPSHPLLAWHRLRYLSFRSRLPPLSGSFAFQYQWRRNSRPTISAYPC